MFTEKLCSKCKQPGDFARDKSRKDGLTAWCRKCRCTNHSNERTKNWQHTNKDRYLATHRVWLANNPEKARAHTKRYATDNPEKVLIKNRRRRAALLGVENSLTLIQWADILEIFNHACAYCLRSDLPLTQDHVIPVSKGGGHIETNVVPACRPCNSRKRNRFVWVMLAAWPQEIPCCV